MRRGSAERGGSEVFAKLRAVRSFHRRRLAMLGTVEDLDLVLEIGWHQERGTPLTMKRLYLLDLGAIATVQRRLRRLREAGVVVPTRAKGDARSVELSISRKIAKALARLCEAAATAAPT